MNLDNYFTIIDNLNELKNNQIIYEFFKNKITGEFPKGVNKFIYCIQHLFNIDFNTICDYDDVYYKFELNGEIYIIKAQCESFNRDKNVIMFGNYFTIYQRESKKVIYEKHTFLPIEYEEMLNYRWYENGRFIMNMGIFKSGTLFDRLEADFVNGLIKIWYGGKEYSEKIKIATD